MPILRVGSAFTESVNRLVSDIDSGQIVVDAQYRDALDFCPTPVHSGQSLTNAETVP